MRLRKINTIEEANSYLPEFMEDHNRRFAKPAINAQDAHQKVQHNSREIDLILSQHSKRKLSNNLELSYHKTLYQLPENEHQLKQKEVTVCDLFSDEIVILHEGKEIAYQVFDRGNAVPELADEKTINSRVDSAIRQQQSSHKPSPLDRS